MVITLEFELRVLGLLLCMLGSAFFAGMETGILAMNRLRLQHLVRRGVPGAATIRYFLTHSDDLLGTTLIGTNLLQVIASVLAASVGHDIGRELVRIVRDLDPDAVGGTAANAAGAAGAAVMGVLLTLGVLVFCEYIPKGWFQASPVRTLRFAGLFRLSAKILRPFSLVVNAVIHRLLPGAAQSDTTRKMALSREELLHLAGEGLQSGVLTPHETEMIHGVFGLTHHTCRTLMTPRRDIVSVLLSATVPQMLETARLHEYNRFPVYDPEKKTFTGILNIFDILSDDAPDRDAKTAADYMRPPQLVAQYLPADHLLPRMRVTRQPLFLVTDDRCETIGLITLEDVLREITGEEDG